MAQLACMTLPYSRYAFERSLEGIAKAGFKYVVFGLPHERNEVYDEADDNAAATLRQQFDRYGLTPVQLVSTPQFTPGQPIERARRRLQLAAALGIREALALGVWGYHKFPDEPLSEAELAERSKPFNEHYKAIAKEAEAAGVVVTLKPHTGNTATAARLRETLAAIGSDWVKASYDAGNVRFYEGISPEDDIESIAPQTLSFVAKDHRGERAHADFPIPGEGEIDFVRMLRTLKSAGFDGPVVVERVDGADRDPLPPEEVDRRLERAHRNLTGIMAEAGF